MASQPTSAPPSRSTRSSRPSTGAFAASTATTWPQSWTRSTRSPREGKDATIIASGVIVRHALEAAETLAAEGIDVRVVDMHTIKPIDEEAVLAAAETGAIVCAQDHTKIGGLGAQVARVLAENACGCKFKILGTPDEYVPLATTEFLYHQNELDAEGLAQNVRALLA